MDAAAIIRLACSNCAEFLWRLTTEWHKKESPKVSADYCDKNNCFKEERCHTKLVMLVLIGIVFLVHRCSRNNSPDAQQLC